MIAADGNVGRTLQSDRLTGDENYSDEGYSQEVGLESPTYVLTYVGEERLLAVHSLLT
jgi:hypothetical protein